MIRILDVNTSNLDRLGFFRFMSKRNSEGYQRKLAWLKERFAEGLRIKLLEPPDRGFIEYLPGEKAWRAVDADGYMVIHCLRVIGKSKQPGYAAALLEECVRDARASGMKGVAAVTSETNWLISRKLFIRHGFACVENAKPAFSLMVKRFGDADPPSFCGDWSAKQSQADDHLTIFTSGQCPYHPDAVRIARRQATEAGIPSRVVELKSSEEVRQHSPSPFGVFGMVHDGCLLSYHYLPAKTMFARLEQGSAR